MKKVLIYQDTDQIKSRISDSNRALPFIQEIHDLVKSMGVDVTMDKIYTLMYINGIYSDKQKQQSYRDWILTELYNKAGNPNINGIPISKDKFALLIDIPDYKPFEGILSKMSGITSPIDPKLYVLDNGKVKLIDNLDEVLTDRFSYYTENEKQNDLVSHLQSLIDSLNLVSGSIARIFTSEILSNDFTFLKKQNGKYYINHNAVRELK